MSTGSKIEGHSDRPLTGILLYGLAVLLIVVMNAFAKKATVYHTPVEVLFYRNLLALLLLLAYVLATRKFSVFKTSRLKTHLSRAIIGNLGVVLVFWTYSLMPMADATALLFTAPLITTLLSGTMLKEQVGPFRWLAVIAGFLGVLLIAEPSGAYYQTYGIAVALGAATATAGVAIFLRDLGRTEDTLTTVFYFLFFGLLFSAPYMAVSGKMPLTATLLPLIGTGLCAGAQLLLKTQAYRYAEASLVSPINFTAILWATILGWLFWDQLPTVPVVAGTGVVIASNLTILWRERRKKIVKPPGGQLY